MSAWPLVPLRKVIEPVDRPESPTPGRIYRQIGVKLWGEGAYEREPLEGSATRYSRLFRTELGDVIVNKIWARNGSVAVVTQDLVGCYASNEFPMFAPRRDQVEPQWIHWLSKTPGFWGKCDEQSRGTSGQNRIRPERFLDIEIPLPPLDQQRQVVARIEELAEKIKEARRLRRQAAEETGALRGAGSLDILRALGRHRAIGDVCMVIDPNPSHRYPSYADDGVPIISSSEFEGEDDIVWQRARRVPGAFYEETLGRFSILPGDIIFSRKGKVGYARAHPAGLRLAMTHTLCILKPNRDLIDPRYLLHVARSPLFVDQLISTMNPNVGVPTLGLGVIRESLVPVPSRSEQQLVVAKLDALQAEVRALTEVQAETATELGALFPAILDRAFRGELV